MKEHIAYFLITFTSLFTVINPFSSMPMFLDITEFLSKSEARQFALKACFAALMAMLIFALSGNLIFSFFDISVNGLKLVGGFLFFIMGYDLLQGKRSRTKKKLEDDVDNSKDAFDSAITPFGIPMICGPGALTVTAVLVQDAATMAQKGILTFTILTACTINFVILIFSKKILNFLGPSGNKVFFRLMGLILMMIAVEYFFAGLKHYIQVVAPR